MRGEVIKDSPNMVNLNPNNLVHNYITFKVEIIKLNKKQIPII